MTLQAYIEKDALELAHKALDNFEKVIKDNIFVASKIPFKQDKYEGNLYHFITTKSHPEALELLSKHYEDELTKSIYIKIKGV
jgi:hypothetical protein